MDDRIPKLSSGSSSRGASMGRISYGKPSGIVFLEPITDPCPAACGAYDYEGAYWGIGRTVWRGSGYDEDGDEFEFTFRGPHPDCADDEEVVAEAVESAEHLDFEGCSFEVIDCQSECAQNGGCEHCCGDDEEEE